MNTKIWLWIVMFGVSFAVQAQVAMPPDTDPDDLPPGCMAQYSIANYCAEAGIFPASVTPEEMMNSQFQSIINNYGAQAAISCYKARINWDSCYRYARNEPEGLCKHFWTHFPPAGERNAVQNEQYQEFSIRCGGATLPNNL